MIERPTIYAKLASFFLPFFPSPLPFVSSVNQPTNHRLNHIIQTRPDTSLTLGCWHITQIESNRVEFSLTY